jgi:hypothetical protein
MRPPLKAPEWKDANPGNVMLEHYLNCLQFFLMKNIIKNKEEGTVNTILELLARSLNSENVHASALFALQRSRVSA